MIYGTKFENVDAATCRLVRDLLDTHLAAINEDTNLCVTVGTMSYDPYRQRFGAKLDISIRDADGTAVSKEAADFKSYAEAGYWDGITADDLGKTITMHDGGKATIVGAKPRSRKYPILAKNANGTVYKYTASSVARALSASHEVVDNKG